MPTRDTGHPQLQYLEGAIVGSMTAEPGVPKRNVISNMNRSSCVEG